MTQTLQKVDHSALKANQLFIISLNILAFILNLPVLAAFVALVSPRLGTHVAVRTAGIADNLDDTYAEMELGGVDLE